MTSPMTPAQGLSKHNRTILMRMKDLAHEMQTLTAELEHLPKLAVWNTTQVLSAGVREMLESDRLR